MRVAITPTKCEHDEFVQIGERERKGKLDSAEDSFKTRQLKAELNVFLGLGWKGRVRILLVHFAGFVMLDASFLGPIDLDVA